ncbi:MAG: hypothetical protein OEV69_00020 [Gammaproteobacteria bacterium]|nr:hypothetical protein [Gammaproteobacteria bacterium]
MALSFGIRVLLPVMIEENTGIIRLRKKHLPVVDRQPTEDDARRLRAAQSPRNAIMASLIVIILFSVLWSMLSVTFGRIFPWLTLLLGFLIGNAVRRAGLGLDWRFPVLAAAFTVLGSLLANIVVAAAFTAPILETTTLAVLTNLTVMTWPVFFDEVMTPADLVIALFGAGIAAFYANRRLTRAEYLALRTWGEKDDR